jgi:phosphoglycolate phosphatase
VKHVIFDLDGTLFNSAEGIFQSFEAAAQSIDLHPPNKSMVVSAIGPPIHNLASLIYPNLSIEQLSAMCAAFRRHYDTVGYLRSSLYDGIVELLQLLAADDKVAKMSIVTNKPTLPSLKLLIQNRLHKYFDEIIGIDYPSFLNQGPNYCSKAQALNELLNSLIESDSLPIYIGDTASDLDAALSAGCNFVAVNYGFYTWQDNHRALLKIADTPYELRSLIDEI